MRRAHLVVVGHLGEVPVGAVRDLGQVLGRRLHSRRARLRGREEVPVAVPEADLVEALLVAVGGVDVADGPLVADDALRHGAAPVAGVRVGVPVHHGRRLLVRPALGLVGRLGALRVEVVRDGVRGRRAQHAPAHEDGIVLRTAGGEGTWHEWVPQCAARSGASDRQTARSTSLTSSTFKFGLISKMSGSSHVVMSRLNTRDNRHAVMLSP